MEVLLTTREQESLLEVRKNVQNILMGLIGLPDLWKILDKLRKPRVYILINIELAHWQILEDLLSSLLVVVEITYLPGVGLHEYVISHLKYSQRSTLKETFNPVDIILIIKFWTDALV